MVVRIYLDYNATAPIRPEVLTLVNKTLGSVTNASSVHSFGRNGRKIIETAREQVAALVGVPPNQIVFNSGATETNNTVLHHFSETWTDQQILISGIEHLSVFEALPKDRNHKIPILSSGEVDLDALENLLKNGKTSLVSIMAVNNESGVIQPIQEAAALTHRYGALFHCDAAQAAGRIPLDMPALGIDFLSLSAHKIAGPQGVGALAMGACGITPILLRGGGQEKKARAGTENVAGIAGFGKAAELAKNNLETYKKLVTLRDDMETGLKKITPPVIIHGKNAPRVANTSFFSLPGARAETLMMALDLEGIAISNGSACSSGTVRESYVLKAMDTPADQRQSAIRVSMGWNTKEEDIEEFLSAWKKVTGRLKK